MVGECALCGASALCCIFSVSLWFGLHCIALGCSIFSARLIWWQVRPHMGERALALPQCLRHLHYPLLCLCSTLLCWCCCSTLLYSTRLHFAVKSTALSVSNMICSMGEHIHTFLCHALRRNWIYFDLQIQAGTADFIWINHTELPCIDMFACFGFCNLQLRR